MKVFLTGANGWIGSAVALELISAGHDVRGLVRTRDRAARLVAGVTPIVGSMSDLDVLRDAAAGSDAIVHTAFGLDMQRIVEMSAEETRVLGMFGEVFAGSDRPLVTTGGVLLTAPGEVFEEDERPPVDPAFPRASEQTTFTLADRGLNASVVRNPRSVHGLGETHGFVPMLAAVAREKGVSAYVGEGLNLWPAVHRLDSARVYRLALERGARGEAYHAIAEKGVAFKAIAEAVGRQVGVPTRSLSPAEASLHFGEVLAMFAAGNGPASSAQTRERLGWIPKEVGLIADVERPSYADDESGASGGRRPTRSRPRSNHEARATTSASQR